MFAFWLFGLILCNYFSRTYFFAFTAIRTFFFINMSYIICNCDCSCRTFFFTFLTSDTAHFTCSHDLFSFFFGTASNLMLSIRDDFNQMFRTLCNTFSAGFTFFLIHFCNPIYDMNCIKRTHFHTVSITKTAKSTGFFTIAFFLESFLILHVIFVLIVIICIKAAILQSSSPAYS